MLPVVTLLCASLVVVFIAYITSLIRIQGMLNAFLKYEKEVDRLVVDINKSYKQAELIGSVKERFNQFHALSADQLDLLGQADRPSANASHSKFKNSIVRELKYLEEKKKAILKSVLDDGIDIEIVMYNQNGVQTKMKISEFLNEHPPSSEKTESNNPQKSKRNLRLVKQPLRLVKEEKSDDTNGTTIH